MPPGAENLHSLIATTDLRVTEVWTPSLNESYVAGNAVKRSITFQASDMPGMVFPRVLIPEIDGIKIYRDRPTISDKLNRGDLTGKRLDSITYVFQKPGTYTLPAISIPWWHLNQKILNTITLPAVDFVVAPSPADPSNPSQANGSIDELDAASISWKWIMALGVGFLFSGCLAYRFRSRLAPVQQIISDWLTTRNESEPAYFKKITSNLSPVEMVNAIHQWLAHSHPSHPSLTAWAAETNDPSLISSIAQLQRSVAVPNANEDAHFDAEALVASLKIARSMKVRSESGHDPSLPPLNPSKS